MTPQFSTIHWLQATNKKLRNMVLYEYEQVVSSVDTNNDISLRPERKFCRQHIRMEIATAVSNITAKFVSLV